MSAVHPPGSGGYQGYPRQQGPELRARHAAVAPEASWGSVPTGEPAEHRRQGDLAGGPSGYANHGYPAPAHPGPSYQAQGHPGPAYPDDHPPRQSPGGRSAGGGPPSVPQPPADRSERRGRAGRNLPVAIGVGVTLGSAVIASLYVWRPAFVVLAALAIMLAIWEMVRAVEPVEARPPMVPLLVGGAVIMVLAWFAGIEAMVLGLVLTVVAVMIWRLGDGPVGYQRDVTSATLIVAYVPFLAGFAVLLVRPEDGAFRVTIMIATVVLSDVGGYAAGVLFGRHPMAPTVSPKKSWEGFAGSLLASAAGGAVMLVLMLDRPWWQGALFGVALAAAATLGDLSESLMKRDLGIKDMGQLLPGHGGLMDRLDSLLLAAPTGYLLLTLFAPPGS